MENINVLLPLHVFNDDVKARLANAVNSYDEASRFISGKTSEIGTVLTVVCAESISNEMVSFVKEIGYEGKCSVMVNNTGKCDFCSQINFAVENISDKYFSILEYDDEYEKKWFSQFNEHLFGHEDVSVFLPVNTVYDSKKPEYWQFGNEMPLASSFSNEIGYVDFDCLQNFSSFNITGAIVRTEDFKKAGKFKPSIKIAFTYELFLRMTKKKCKIFVVPKIGYKHAIGVEGSLMVDYEKTIPSEDIVKWFDLAKRECSYKDDREKDISKAKKVGQFK